jgi:hypothetical protein
VLRDAILSVSGKLNVKAFGPPAPVAPDMSGQVVIGKDTRDDVGRPNGNPLPLGGEEFRRSVYVQVRRSLPLAVLAAFDAPTMEPCCEQRSSTTVTPQSLMLMNSAFIADSAQSFADRLRQESAEPRTQVERGWRLAFAGTPTPAQADEAVKFLAEQAGVFHGEGRPDADRLALASFCQALLSTNLFLYVD